MLVIYAPSMLIATAELKIIKKEGKGFISSG